MRFQSLELWLRLCEKSRGADCISLPVGLGRECRAVRMYKSPFQVIRYSHMLRKIGGGVLGDVWSSEQRGQAMTMYTLAPLLGPCIGPICGAWIAERSSWRWVVSPSLSHLHAHPSMNAVVLVYKHRLCPRAGSGIVLLERKYVCLLRWSHIILTESCPKLMHQSYSRGKRSKLGREGEMPRRVPRRRSGQYSTAPTESMSSSCSRS